MSDTTRVPYRGLITAFAMLAMFMQTLDSTIANVALPYMQGSMSASYDEITWVLTSYVIAAAIMTAPVGWMAVRFGRKRLFVTCITGFTVVSMMCGAAQSLEQLVIFRLLQGAELLKAYASSPGKQRVFCGNCGSPLYSRADALPGVLRLRMGSLDTPAGSKPQAHIFAASRAEWYDILDGLPQHAERP